ncbi:hypothetical protein [Bradyrhizobium sp. SZCCHNR3058]|uniref:hypothetical protein n=1 Tax=Bradyrhizobium sp. SZCCHNR3058 TaxID=3057423 RepID=UPI0029167CA4|nr:hypothetical protein [Bradyrhizobium sp. SZCCHNR3058]
MTTIYQAASLRFNTGYYVYGISPSEKGTQFRTYTVHVNGTPTTKAGIGIDCSNLVYQSLLAAGYNVQYLPTSGIYSSNGSLTADGSKFYSAAAIPQQKVSNYGDSALN